MQDAERLQEQVDEMVAKAETRAEVAKAHHEAVVKQRHVANRELSKFKFLNEVFTFGQDLLGQRREALLKEETAPEPHVLEGLAAAFDELGRISRQAQDATHRCDGSQAALSSLEEAFRNEEVQATSRARGLAVQGQRAVDVAASRGGTNEELEPEPEEKGVPTVAEAARKVPGLISSLQKKQRDEDSAKEPIASP